MMSPFSITLNIGGLELDIKGNYDPGRAVNLKGHPDSWTPPESGELEVLEVKNNGFILDFDRTEFVEHWEEQIIDIIENPTPPED